MWVIYFENTIYVSRKIEGSLNWTVMTEQEFIGVFGSNNDSVISDIEFFDGGCWKSVVNSLNIDKGLTYYQIDVNKYESDNSYDGNIITVTISDNGYISEILYCDANTGEPKWKYVYEFGNVELPEIPNYNK
jgi:hypothetical protein